MSEENEKKPPESGKGAEKAPTSLKRSLAEKFSPKKVVVTFGGKKNKQGKGLVPDAIEPQAPTHVVTSPVDLPPAAEAITPPSKATVTPMNAPQQSTKTESPAASGKAEQPPLNIHYPEPSAEPPLTAAPKTEHPSWEETLKTAAPTRAREEQLSGTDMMAKQTASSGGSPPPPSQGKSSSAAQPTPPASGGGGGGFATFVSIVALCGVGYLGYAAYESKQQVHALLIQTDTDTAQVQTLAQEIKQSVQQIVGAQEQTKQEKEALAVLKGQVQRAQSQLAVLRKDTPWVLSEVQYLLFMANERLKIAQDIPTAILQLETAEDRLNQLGDPALLQAQEAIRKDVANLKLIPEADTQGIWAELAAINTLLRTMPFKNLQRFNQDTTMEETETQSQAPKSVWKKALWSSWLQIKDLIRVTRIEDNPIQPALALQDKAQIMHTMQLMTEQAQWAALHGESLIYEKQLHNLAAWIEQYLAPSAQRAQVENQLKVLAQTNIANPKANINASLQALSIALRKRPVASTQPASSSVKTTTTSVSAVPVPASATASGVKTPVTTTVSPATTTGNTTP